MSVTSPFENDFDEVFANRMKNLPRSFIQEILNVALRPGMISFAGGLPNKDLFPAEAIKDACDYVMKNEADQALQYCNSEGLAPLREAIAARYAKRGVRGVKAENIMITCGSQQALDLLAKILVNEGDRVAIEEPAYLGAIQALAMYRPRFSTIPLHEEGLDLGALEAALRERVKLMYLVPNFQNPSGLTYSDENRRAVADLVGKTKTFLIEDDPYGELRFEGAHRTSFMNLIPDNTILLGTFSKTVVPGFRLGWAVVPKGLYPNLLVAKQGSDLNTSAFSQRVVARYLAQNDPDEHIAKIVEKYARQKNDMVGMIQKHFPANVAHTNPQGGMFLWVTLPNGAPAMKFFEKGVEKNVCVVPGHPFYVGKDDVSTMRFSFSTVDYATMEEGISRLGDVARELCA